MKTLEKRTTVSTDDNNYWNDSGAYAKEYNHLYATMVPASGEAKTLNGELIRALSRLYYEWCNNGNCNAKEVTYAIPEMSTCGNCSGSGEDDEEEDGVCAECGGSGEYECDDEEIDDIFVTEFYGRFLLLISTTVPESKELTERVEKVITHMYTNAEEFSVANYQKYDDLVDAVVHYVLEHEDKEIPAWYLSEEPVDFGHIEEKSKVKLVDGKPSVILIGVNSNVYNLLAICTRALKAADMPDKAEELSGKVLACGSYDEALVLMMEYCDVN